MLGTTKAEPGGDQARATLVVVKAVSGLSAIARVCLFIRKGIVRQERKTTASYESISALESDPARHHPDRYMHSHSDRLIQRQSSQE